MKIKIDCPFCDRVDSISKANSVQFEELSWFDNKLIDEFKSVEDLNKFRLNLYNLFKTQVKIDFVKLSEDYNGDILEKQGFKLESDVITLSDNDIGRCLPFYIVKKYFYWSRHLHKYMSKEKILNSGCVL